MIPHNLGLKTNSRILIPVTKCMTVPISHETQRSWKMRHMVTSKNMKKSKIGFRYRCWLVKILKTTNRVLPMKMMDHAKRKTRWTFMRIATCCTSWKQWIAAQVRICWTSKRPCLTTETWTVWLEAWANLKTVWRKLSISTKTFKYIWLALRTVGFLLLNNSRVKLRY